MRTLLLILYIFFALPCLGQIRTCVNIDGYWGDWSNDGVYIPENYYAITGRTTDFVVYSKFGHPSEYIFRVVITNYQNPTKGQIKLFRKNNKWYTYTGYVEYCPQYDGIKKEYTLAKFIENFNHGNCYYNENRVKRYATIKIAPYKKSPRVYNIWFEGYGVGIQLY